MNIQEFGKRMIVGMEEAAKGVIRVANEGGESIPSVMDEVSRNLETRKKEFTDK